MTLIKGSRYGDVRKQAAQSQEFTPAPDPTPHSLPPDRMQAMLDRMDKMMPKLVGGRGGARSRAESFFSRMLPQGATLAPGAGQGLRQAELAHSRQGHGGGGGGHFSGPSSLSSVSMPYLPEFASIDRQCMIAGTRVMLANGKTRAIENIAPGQMVKDRKGQAAKVVRAWSEGVPENLVEIVLTRGTKLYCTANHNWPVVRAGGHAKVEARGLSLDDLLTTPRGEELPIRSLAYVKNTKRLAVYNLSVEGDHSYVVEGVGTYNSYPTHRSLANNYFRMFKKLDPHVGTCLEMLGTMMWSDFELVDVDGEIRDRLEMMCERTQVRAVLPHISEEYLALGEAAPHCVWDEYEGMWSHVGLHDPDNLNIIQLPVLGMDEPIAQMKPDHQMQQALNYPHPRMQQAREMMPPEVLMAIQSGQPIDLSPVNFTFIPRKLHPYDVRGTSILSRLWRIFMLEDAIYDASISAARRHAGPLKVAKLGDPSTGHVPGPEAEARLHEMLAQAEMDVNAWLVWSYAIQFEEVGTNGRITNIRDYGGEIERTKLIALGVSKSFLHGEVSYACFASDTLVYDEVMGFKEIQNVKPNDQVIDMHGESQRVLNAWCEGTPETLTKITLHGALTFEVTHNHRWPVWAWPRTCACGCGAPLTKPGQAVTKGHSSRINAQGLTFKLIDGGHGTNKKRVIPEDYEPVQKLRSDEIRVGDFLMVPRTFTERDPGIQPEQARLLGYYVAEGSVFDYNGQKDKQQACYTLGAESAVHYEKDIRGIYSKIAEDVTCYNNKAKKASITEIKTAREGGWRIGNWLKEMAGTHAKQKRLHPDVMSWPLALKRELIKGCFRGDGSQTLATRTYKGKTTGPYLQVSYSTGSETLAKSLWRILVQLGYVGTFLARVRTDSRPGWPDKTESWEINFQGQTAREIADLVWEERSLSSEVRKTRDVTPAVKMDEKYAYLPVKKVEVIPNTKPVYNIEVEGTHSYLVDGVATYNSAASGLTVFLRRLRAARDFFQAVWLQPKFFNQVSEMNGWYERSEADYASMKSGAGPAIIGSRRKLIRPRIVWSQSLDDEINTTKLQAIQALEGLGIRFSEQTKFALVNEKWDDQMEQRIDEARHKQQVAKDNPDVALLGGSGDTGGGGGGGGGGLGGGGGMPMPSSSEEEPAVEAPADMADLDASFTAEETDTTGGPLGTDDHMLHDLVAVFEGQVPESDTWARMYEDAQHEVPPVERLMADLQARDNLAAWRSIKEWLFDEGASEQLISQLRGRLVARGILPQRLDLERAEASMMSETFGGDGLYTGRF